MVVIDRSALLGHSAQQMYALVNDVESYPRFLPWCDGAQVRPGDGPHTLATIQINFSGIRQRFTTQNLVEPGSLIGMSLVSGPFRHLQGLWRFTPLGEAACKVELRLEYQFASRLLERAVGPVFNHIANTLMDAFAKRAEELHGRR
jgi:ribosome-associated toxin RatA of RatAB toxin-antitoxin module